MNLFDFAKYFIERYDLSKSEAMDLITHLGNCFITDVDTEEVIDLHE